MNSSQDLLNLALQSPSPERASLARQLLLSLEPDTTNGDYEEVWQGEIKSRMARVEEGNYSASEWREALARIRASLAQGTAR